MNDAEGIRNLVGTGLVQLIGGLMTAAIALVVLFYLNWRARVRNSTLNGAWRLNWYFNFFNARGLAFHQFDLPGLPASHACVRLLERDAMWIYQWGQSWTLDATGQLLQNGTPVLIVGSYAFGAPPPWRSIEQLARPIVLPDPVPEQ